MAAPRASSPLPSSLPAPVHGCSCSVSPASVQPTALGGGLRTRDTWWVRLIWAPAPVGCAFSSLLPPLREPQPHPLGEDVTPHPPSVRGDQRGQADRLQGDAQRQRGRQARALWAGRGALARLCQAVLPPPTMRPPGTPGPARFQASPQTGTPHAPLPAPRTGSIPPPAPPPTTPQADLP